MDLAGRIQNAIRYIEDNLTDELDFEEIAKQAFFSSYHFQRIFNVFCGITPGEYIRNRRLTLAGLELSKGEQKVIDMALKYGYDSPDSFTKAFSRFHGISPSAAGKDGAKLKSYAPLKIKIIFEGGIVMEYKILKKDEFTVIGKARDFDYETSYSEIPKFWDEHFSGGDGKHIMGMFGVCYENTGNKKSFGYMIADEFNPENVLPDGFVKKTLPANTWAVFTCKGELPKSLQDVNTRIWSEWLPNCAEYELAGDYNIEAYLGCPSEGEDFISEIWIPVKKV